MDIWTAAEELDAHLREVACAALTAVGVRRGEGESWIVVYLRRWGVEHTPLLAKLVKDGWRGYPVRIERMGQVRPAAQRD